MVYLHILNITVDRLFTYVIFEHYYQQLNGFDVWSIVTSDQVPLNFVYLGDVTF